ncbi:elongation factor Ts [Candidatus Campbellbacteria bacterium CG22_combo_CG10-13_8_21_14_all_36_13]|uniref:Elongation factor Ts n=1 Tax=Candidatus Campbellbacteria bacterium CG22_combo_CG10-13_8_21_14_all_36_13 TaxID=1974529 RepID=A0A2H0DYB1_9BACT|nr:MAG: elongation factor Ts [Candidatus Campbellbacteria bacterium CG22_combo_CG10-13_8_21_14_all_36_13]
MEITTENIKELRDQTGVSIMQCKKALEEAGGDMNQAMVILQKKSGATALKKADRNLKSGTIASYVHAGGTVATLVELACETDFVARNEDFQKLAYDIAMHVAAMNPVFLSIDDVTEGDRAAALEVFKKEVEDKPKDMQEKIIEGKMNSYFQDKVLLTQAYIKDGDKTIDDLIKGAIQKFGENMRIIRYTRFAVGQ